MLNLMYQIEYINLIDQDTLLIMSVLKLFQETYKIINMMFSRFKL